MKFYFAPMEGITGYIYRNSWNRYFGGVDKYFTPFISPNENRGIGSRERRDVLPENNTGVRLVPQILTNRAQHFIVAAKELEQLGYREINLNLGCPSGTVVAKNKGAGFLANREELNRFLEEIFSASPVPISIKTRIGKDSPGEFAKLLPMFNQYPLTELIIHPRIRTDFYKNKPNLEIFGQAIGNARAPLCYNGDLFTPLDFEEFSLKYPGVEAVMMGRGLLCDPGLIGEILTGKMLEKETLIKFHDDLYQAYREKLSGDRTVLFKVKELWAYMHHLFEENERYFKKIKKATRLCDYEEAVRCLFAERNILPTHLRESTGKV